MSDLKLRSLPQPRLYTDWNSWANVLIQQLSDILQEQDIPSPDILLAATGVGALSATTVQYISWTSDLSNSSKAFFHDTAANQDTITFNKKGYYIVSADLGFTATALQNVDARVYVNGSEYGVLTRSIAEGTNYIKCPIIGALVRVQVADTLKIGVQASATTISQALSRLWMRAI